MPENNNPKTKLTEKGFLKVQIRTEVIKTYEYSLKNYEYHIWYPNTPITEPIKRLFKQILVKNEHFNPKEENSTVRPFKITNAISPNPLNCPEGQSFLENKNMTRFRLVRHRPKHIKVEAILIKVYGTYKNQFGKIIYGLLDVYGDYRITNL